MQSASIFCQAPVQEGQAPQLLALINNLVVTRVFVHVHGACACFVAPSAPPSTQRQKNRNGRVTPKATAAEAVRSFPTPVYPKLTLYSNTHTKLVSCQEPSVCSSTQVYVDYLPDWSIPLMAAFVENPNPFPTGKVAVVGIDLGTTYSGISIVLESSRDSVTASAPGATFPQVKEPTVLLETMDKKWLFGCEALEHFKNAACEDDEESVADAKLYKLFKLNLLGTEPMDFNDVLVKAHNTNQRESLLHVYAMAFTVLKDHALKSISKNAIFERAVTAQEVFWVLTIPANTSEYCKSFMREAAFQAGLISEKTSGDLSFLLEPEAAAVALSHGSSGPFGVGSKFIVVDCGGGTVDVTSHEVIGVNPLALKSLASADRSNCGSEMINASFMQWLVGKLPSKSQQDLKEKPGLLLEIEQIFDAIKTSFKADKSQLGYVQLRSVLEEREESEEFAERIRQYNESVDESLRVTFQTKNKNLRLSRELMMTFFAPQLAEIVRLVRNVRDDALARGNAIDFIVVVGGFASSDILQKHIEEEFRGSRVLFPDTPIHPQSAVVIGAARAGSQGSSAPIRNRVATMTIGAFFEPNYFRPLVRIGEDVPVDSTKELVGYPVNATQQQCQWRLYQSKKLNPTTIDGETPLGSLTIDVPQTGNVSDREMRAQFSFGEAEIGVTVEFPKQGRKERGTVRFDKL